MKEYLTLGKRLLKSVGVTIARAVNPPLDNESKPLDIQQAIVEAIEERAQPIGGGRRDLPDRYVKISVVSKGTADERALRTALKDIRAVVVRRLRELRCDVPATFRIDVSYLAERPVDWDESQRLSVIFEAEAPKKAAGASAKRNAAQPALVLTVVRGKTSSPTYTFREPLVRVGRSSAPVDDRGHARHNHVAFADTGDQASATVGRGHSQIRYDAESGDYRVFDEGSANGTRVLRDGEVVEVPPRDPFGISLQTDDELQFGSAAVKVEVAYED